MLVRVALTTLALCSAASASPLDLSGVTGNGKGLDLSSLTDGAATIKTLGPDNKAGLLKVTSPDGGLKVDTVAGTTIELPGGQQQASQSQQSNNGLKVDVNLGDKTKTPTNNGGLNVNLDLGGGGDGKNQNLAQANVQILSDLGLENPAIQDLVKQLTTKTGATMYDIDLENLGGSVLGKSGPFSLKNVANLLSLDRQLEEPLWQLGGNPSGLLSFLDQAIVEIINAIPGILNLPDLLDIISSWNSGTWAPGNGGMGGNGGGVGGSEVAPCKPSELGNPGAYKQEFSDISTTAANGPDYLTYGLVPKQCAAKRCAAMCTANKQNGCVAFNTYEDRNAAGQKGVFYTCSLYKSPILREQIDNTGGQNQDRPMTTKIADSKIFNPKN